MLLRDEFFLSVNSRLPNPIGSSPLCRLRRRVVAEKPSGIIHFYHSVWGTRSGELTKTMARRMIDTKGIACR